MSTTFRIRTKSTGRTKQELEDQLLNIQDTGGAKPGKQNDYLARLVSLIPGEVLGIYLMLQNAVKSSDGDLSWQYAWISVSCLILVIISRIMGTRDRAEGDSFFKQIEWPVVIISSVSFVIWVLGIGDPFLGVSEISYFNDEIVIMALVAIWTFIVPYFYKQK